jgi:hypothetical protein
MPVITVTYSKLLVQRLGEPKGKISINNNVTIKEITKSEIALGTYKQNALRFQFEFTTKYEPDYAEILLAGDLIYLVGPTESVDAIIKDWKKDKSTPKDITTEVVNNILTRCNIQALILSREMNLPSPIPLPKMQNKS